MLGILAINITGFWGPPLASSSPIVPIHQPGPELGSVAWFVIAFVLFEGKMRALFTLLFGASMLLFIAAAERRGASGTKLQARRLLWLGGFGYLHYLLLWWGDILATYALCGLVALGLRRLQTSGLVAVALFALLGFAALDGGSALIGVAKDARVAAGITSPEERAKISDTNAHVLAKMHEDVVTAQAPFTEAVRRRATRDPWLPLRAARETASETIPLMLLGMALFQSGFFSGRWSRRKLVALAFGGIGAGGAATLGLAWLIASTAFSLRMTSAAITPWGTLPAIAMGLGYAALFMLAWPWLSRSAIGRRLALAGRVAFTNYLGTTLVMCALFSGWGLALGVGGPHPMPRGVLPLVMLAGWALMLAWPGAWLARFGQGPLEALWRRLTWWGVAR